MTDQSPPAASPNGDARDRLFPRLTPAQMARLLSHGQTRSTSAGEILLEQGDLTDRFFAVLDGDIEIVRPRSGGEELIVVHGPGEFVGDVHLLSGRRSIVRARVRTPGQVVALSRDSLLALIQTDADLSGILMRAFILRRVELMASGAGDVVIVGIEPLVRDAPAQGVPGPQRLSLLVPRPGEGPLRAGRHRSFRGHRSTMCPSCCAQAACAEEPIERRARRLSRVQRDDRRHARARRPHHRRRPGRPGRGGLRGLGRAEHAGSRVGRTRRPGRLKLEDRELPRVPVGCLRPRPGRARLHAGGEVRRRSAHRAQRASGCTATRGPTRSTVDGDRRFAPAPS